MTVPKLGILRFFQILLRAEDGITEILNTDERILTFSNIFSVIDLLGENLWRVTSRQFMGGNNQTRCLFTSSLMAQVGIQTVWTFWFIFC